MTVDLERIEKMINNALPGSFASSDTVEDKVALILRRNALLNKGACRGLHCNHHVRCRRPQRKRR